MTTFQSNYKFLASRATKLPNSSKNLCCFPQNPIIKSANFNFYIKRPNIGISAIRYKKVNRVIIRIITIKQSYSEEGTT